MLFIACTNDNMQLQFPEGVAGKIVIRGYSVSADSLQVRANGKLLNINNNNTFKGAITTDYDFVFYNHEHENIDVINKATGEVVKSYSFSDEIPVDTLSFYAKDVIWIDNVLSFKPGTLSGTGRTGYRFIFPTINRYSNSGYDGPVDAIIKKTNGQVLGIAENITKDSFSNFVEFAYAPPPVLTIELVKHGTTESYINGQQVIVQIVMQNNRSKLIVLDEKTNESGTFTGVDGTITLTDFFYF